MNGGAGRTADPIPFFSLASLKSLLVWGWTTNSLVAVMKANFRKPGWLPHFLLVRIAELSFHDIVRICELP